MSNNKELNFFAVSIKKIEDTSNDYELITSLNPCFEALTKEELAQVEDIAFNAVRDLKVILRNRNIIG